MVRVNIKNTAPKLSLLNPAPVRPTGRCVSYLLLFRECRFQRFGSLSTCEYLNGRLMFLLSGTSHTVSMRSLVKGESSIYGRRSKLETTFGRDKGEKRRSHRKRAAYARWYSLVRKNVGLWLRSPWIRGVQARLGNRQRNVSSGTNEFARVCRSPHAHMFTASRWSRIYWLR